MSKILLIYSLSTVLLLAGIAHFITPEVFLPAMPTYLPWHQELIFFTGLIEVVLSIGLLIERLRRVSAYLIVAYFIAILPAHIHVSTNEISMFGVSHPAFLWGRTLFQGVFIYWAFKVAKTSQKKSAKKSLHLYRLKDKRIL